MNTYFVIYVLSALLAIVTVPWLVRFATWRGLLDAPGPRRVHYQSVPRLGGAAIVFPTIALATVTTLLNNTIGEAFRAQALQVSVLLGTSLAVFLVGLADDIWGLSARAKFSGELLAALAVCGSGVTITTVPIPGVGTIQLGFLSIPVTLLWIVGITNAVNLIDGLDGLAAGISAVTCGTIAAIAIYMGRPVMAVIMLALLGSLSGFLIFNFNPAKIFLGDSGSLFLGFLLASSSVMTSHKTSAVVALGLPLLALGIPVFDTFLPSFAEHWNDGLHSPRTGGTFTIISWIGVWTIETL